MFDLVHRMLIALKYGIGMAQLPENKNAPQQPAIMISKPNSGSCRWDPCYISSMLIYMHKIIKIVEILHDFA